MVVVMQIGATPDEVRRVEDAIESAGFRSFINPGVERKVIAVLGVVDAQKALLADKFASMPGVERVTPISEPYKLPSRHSHPEDTVVRVGDAQVGGRALAIIAGPCSVESREQMLETAHAVKEAGANLLRGGAYKPRTSPYAFQGLGPKGLEFLAEARSETGLPIVTEVLDSQDIDIVAGTADVLQIGARNMQNFRLLQQVGQRGLPVLLKRAAGCRLRELLTAAEYIMLEGNANVILCERGITTFEDSSRYTTDVNAIPAIKHFSHLPVLIDPSHSTGYWRYVSPVALAGVAAGADGVIVEVHPRPEEALSDGPQALRPEKFKALVESLARVAQAVDRQMP
jgi:3-deoxy-7-phosphoheptulonate synthase